MTYIYIARGMDPRVVDKERVQHIKRSAPVLMGQDRLLMIDDGEIFFYDNFAEGDEVRDMDWRFFGVA